MKQSLGGFKSEVNELMMILKEVEGLRHKQFGRALPVEPFARPGVELPRTVRIGEIDIDASHLGEPLVLRHSLNPCLDTPLSVSQREPTLRVDVIEDGPKAGNCRFGGGIVHSCQGHEQRGSLDQRTDGRRVASALDQIALPVAGDDALVDFRGGACEC